MRACGCCGACLDCSAREIPPAAHGPEMRPHLDGDDADERLRLLPRSRSRPRAPRFESGVTTTTRSTSHAASRDASSAPRSMVSLLSRHMTYAARGAPVWRVWPSKSTSRSACSTMRGRAWKPPTTFTTTSTRSARRSRNGRAISSDSAVTLNKRRGPSERRASGRRRLGQIRPGNRMNRSFKPLADFPARDFQIVLRLQVEPELPSARAASSVSIALLSQLTIIAQLARSATWLQQQRAQLRELQKKATNRTRELA